ncbi:hypothetical protein RQP46_007114 [Phenoliferia psychrophenolica]
MPLIDVPGYPGLSLFYTINPTVDSSTGTIIHDSAPLDLGKPNLVLLHGAFGSSTSFSAQLTRRFGAVEQFSDARLSQSYNLIGIDSPMHGQTKGLDVETHTMQDSADCIIAVLDALQLKSYALVGESMKGCNEAGWIAIKRPNHVRAICLVSPSWHLTPTEVVNSIDEFIPMLVSNKDGKGDQSGNLPDAALEVVENFYFSGISRSSDRRLFFREGVQKRSRGGADLRIIAGAPHLPLATDFSVANRFILAFMSRYYGDV